MLQKHLKIESRKAIVFTSSDKIWFGNTVVSSYCRVITIIV